MRIGIKPINLLICLILIMNAALLESCAVHYYDSDTQTEHIWGFGHMKMKYLQANEGLQAVVHGTDVIGASIGKADKHGYFTLGWQRLQFIDIVQENTAVRLEWPTSDFASVRIGSRFPDTSASPFELQPPVNSNLHKTLSIEVQR